MTKIEWTDATWNPVTGCTKCSPGCDNCYAERMTRRFWRKWGCLAPPHHFGVKWHVDRLEIPLHWRKPQRIFVCSMSDLFHPAVPFEFINKVFAIIALSPKHKFQVLTKRAKRMQQYLTTKNRWSKYILSEIDKLQSPYGSPCEYWWPLNNVWLGVSISTQKEADEKIPILLKIPVAVRFVSLEPLLEPIIFTKGLWSVPPHKIGKLDWGILGCESGPKRRPCPDPRGIVGQFHAASIPLFVKQLSINGKVSHDPAEWPEDLRERNWPSP